MGDRELIEQARANAGVTAQTATDRLLVALADRLEALAGPMEREGPTREKIVECIRDAADRGFEAGSRGEARFRFNDIIARADALLSAAPKPEAAG